MMNPDLFNGLVGEDRALELVKSRYTLSSTASNEHFSKLNVWFGLYKSRQTNKNYRGLANLFIPKSFEKVERASALIFQSIRKIRMVAQEPQDVESAEFNEELIDFERRVLNLDRIIKLWIKDARIHGTSFLKVTWNHKQEDPKHPYKGLECSLIDPLSIFVNPDATSETGIRWCIHELDIPLAELKNNKMYKNIDLLEKMATPKPQKGTLQQRASRTTQKTIDDSSTVIINIKEYWGSYRKSDKGKEQDYRIIVANDEVVILEQQNKYSDILHNPIPIFPMRTYNVPHEFNGVGDIEVIESLQNELNDTRNQRMDMVTLNIDPAKEILRGAQINENELVAKKGWVIHSSIPNGVRFIPPDMQGVRASIEEERIIQGDIDRTLGIPSFGADTPVMGDLTQDTATGVRAMQQAQDVMTASVVEEMKFALTEFYRTILAYNQAFINNDFIINLEGKDGKTKFSVITPDRIKGNIDVDVSIDTNQDRFQRQAVALQALNIAKEIPGANIGQFFIDYLETIDKENVEMYYQSPQPQGPPPPSINISLRGELTGEEVDVLAGQQLGLPQEATDPMHRPETRELMTYVERTGKMPQTKFEQEEQAAQTEQSNNPQK